MALDEATGKHIKVDIEQPRWDQSTYWGRATHFFTTANPLNVFATPSQLDHAKDIVSKYRRVRIRTSILSTEFKNILITPIISNEEDIALLLCLIGGTI